MSRLSQLEIDDSNIAFHPDMGNSYQLNPLGIEIIELLKQGKVKAEIVETLQKKYQLRYNELFIDISDFFVKLKVYGLL